MISIKAIQWRDKKVLLRLDLDLPENEDGLDTSRLEVGAQTLNHLLKRGAAHVHVIGHWGRPNGKVVKKYDLKKVGKLLLELVPEKARDRVSIGENLRFDPGEEKNHITFARKLAKGHDMYVNDAFATAHREHASIVQLPYLLPTVMGRQFEREVKALRKLYHQPARPVTFILGGAKEDKLEFIDKLSSYINVFLIGGKLAAGRKEELEAKYKNLIVGDLTADGLDITKDSTEQFERFIRASETVIWNGPVGKYEDPAGAAGTEYLANVITKTKIYSVIGGGDTEAAMDHLGFKPEQFSHVCLAGGAMMEYLINGTLPGVKAIEEGQKQFSWEKDLEFVL